MVMLMQFSTVHHMECLAESKLVAIIYPRVTFIIKNTVTAAFVSC